MALRPLLSELVADWRQWRYPAALRITSPGVPGTADVLALLERFRDLQPAEPPASQAPTADDRELIAALCTSAWSLRRRMIDPATDRPRPELRRAYSDVKALWRALDDRGVRIIDHTGEHFDDGLSLDVVTFEPRDDLVTDTIIETIKPTIVLDGMRIQVGEVVVGTPPKS
jgi:hypothetical protein